MVQMNLTLLCSYQATIVKQDCPDLNHASVKRKHPRILGALFLLARSSIVEDMLSKTRFEEY
jgi:hypothetical protein